jgi:hypothetical protein
MSPYEILGIRPTATLDEAEAAYRGLLRECHPDLHVHAGPDAVAWAEQRTRQLNAAIHTIRSQNRVFASSAGNRFAQAHGFTTGVGTDYFGNPTHSRVSVGCPLCEAFFEDAREFRVHLVLDHAFANQMARRARRARRPIHNWMSWVPAPMFWSLLLLIVYWCVLFGMLGDSAMALVGMWIGVFAYLFFLPFAYKAERYRKRF